MAIYERDRAFHRIFSEIDLDIIPLRFVKDITCHLSDGKKIILSKQDLIGSDIENNDLESAIKSLEFYSEITDLQIQIDYDGVEHDVGLRVAQILNEKSA